MARFFDMLQQNSGLIFAGVAGLVCVLLLISVVLWVVSIIARGGLMAWGLVPTLSPEDLERETTDSLFAQWQSKSDQVARLGIDRQRLIAQSLITPACGMGTLRVDLALKALRLTRELSNWIRNEQRATSSE